MRAEHRVWLAELIRRDSLRGFRTYETPGGGITSEPLPRCTLYASVDEYALDGDQFYLYRKAGK